MKTNSRLHYEVMPQTIGFGLAFDWQYKELVVVFFLWQIIIRVWRK